MSFLETRKTVVLIIALFFLAGCARSLDYSRLNTHMRNSRCSEAVAFIENHESYYGGNEKLLFYLDSAMVHMMCGNFEKSNFYLHSAEELARDLWTKSVTQEAASFLINDYTKPYAGEDFEKALINLFSAINYMELQKLDDALVECRRLDSFLSEINEYYEKKNAYREDAFGRYLGGMIYEADNDPENAYIDYYKALQAFLDYKEHYGTLVPRIFLEDLLRVADEVNRSDEIDPLIEDEGNIEWMKYGDAEKLGKVVIIHFNGRAPVKVGDKVVIPTKNGPVTVAFPRYAVRRPSCRSSTVIVKSEALNEWKEAETELVEDINAIAVQNLDDRRGRVMAKTLARVVAKRVAINSATKDKNKRFLLNLADVFVERADTRSWRTLPGEIYLSRLFLPPGEYDVYLRRCGGVEEPVRTISLKTGQTRFVLYESMY